MGRVRRTTYVAIAMAFLALSQGLMLVALVQGPSEPMGAAIIIVNFAAVAAAAAWVNGGEPKRTDNDSSP